MERKIGGLTVPKGAMLPTLSDWLEENDLTHLQTPLQGWRLKTMLQTCNDGTFETDFAVLTDVDRRNLQVALRDTLQELQPPTPSPPTMKRPRPRKSTGTPSSSSRPARPGQMPSYAPSDIDDWEENDDDADIRSAQSVRTSANGGGNGGGSDHNSGGSDHTARQSTASSSRVSAAGVGHRRQNAW